MTLYLSFSDDDGWRGCVIAPDYQLTRDDLMAALIEAHRRGVNPGGSVASALIPDDVELPEGVEFWHLYATREEAEEVFGPMENVADVS